MIAFFRGKLLFNLFKFRALAGNFSAESVYISCDGGDFTLAVFHRLAQRYNFFLFVTDGIFQTGDICLKLGNPAALLGNYAFIFL